MKRLIVSSHKEGGTRLAKGISIGDDEVRKIDDLVERVKVLFNDDSITGLKVDFDNRQVEVADLDFLRDGDHVAVITGDGRRCARFPFTKEPGHASDWITLNVGGTIFSTCKSTVTVKAPGGVLARMFASEESGLMSACRLDQNGHFLIDRTAAYFEPVLNYLRTGKLVLDDGINVEGVYEEAKYFGIDALICELELMLAERNHLGEDVPLTRRRVIKAVISTPVDRELRFQGVDMAGADLSRLDLRNINFKYANMKGCTLKGANLSWCNLERVDLSGATLDGAQLAGVQMLCANLEGSSLKSCRFDDPTGAIAVLEGANLKNANLEDSSMAGVNLRVATLKHVNMKNCYLKSAVLAGADLEFGDLSGSDLYEANLRGANLKDCLLELMPTPLHMSQTIR